MSPSIGQTQGAIGLTLMDNLRVAIATLMQASNVVGLARYDPDRPRLPMPLHLVGAVGASGAGSLHRRGGTRAHRNWRRQRRRGGA